MGRLSGKKAFVTAAAQGIGRATALAFAAEGAEVFATDVNEAGLAGLPCRTARLDVLDAAAVAAAARAHGPADVLFNCAGIVHQGSILETTEADLDAAYALNVRAMFRMIQAFLPSMLERGSGSVVNVASVCGSIKGLPNRVAYGTSKAAVIGLTKAVAADTISRGVRCNCVCPGTVQTPSLEERIAANAAAAGGLEAARAAFVGRQAMGRLGTPEEIAMAAVYLASDESVFMTGQAMIVDGGITL